MKAPTLLIVLSIFFMSVLNVEAGSQTFNSNGTFIVPTGVTSISVTASAGGGGGGNPFGAGHPMIGSVFYNGGGGGSGGHINNLAFAVVPGSSLSVQVGNAGFGTVNGGNTSVASLFSLTGGLSAYYLSSTVAQAGVGGTPNGQSGAMSCFSASGSMSCPSYSSVGGLGGGNSVGGVRGVGSASGSCLPTAGTRGAGGGGQAWGCPTSGAAGGPGFVTISWPDPTGSIQVTANIPGASYTLTGPSTLNGSGDSTLHNNVIPGIYTITWNPVAGYTAPLSSSSLLTSGGTTSFVGTYTPLPSIELYFSN